MSVGKLIEDLSCPGGAGWDALRACIGRPIGLCWIEPTHSCRDGRKDNRLRLIVEGSTFILRDAAAGCCEERYFHTDDDIASIIGAKLVNVEIVDGGTGETDHGEVRECQF